MSALTEAASHIAAALDHHDNKRPGSARRAMKNCQDCINDAISQAPPAQHDPITNPTAAQGAQTSNGQQPRNFSADDLAKRMFGGGSARRAK